jgi:hypothetical protein
MIETAERQFKNSNDVKRYKSSVGGRTKAARKIKQLKQALLEHFQYPSPLQLQLIERAVWCYLRIGALDKSFAANNTQTAKEEELYVDTCAILSDLLNQMGLKVGYSQRLPSPHRARERVRLDDSSRPKSMRMLFGRP